VLNDRSVTLVPAQAEPESTILSKREGEVLDLLATGLTNRAMATRLGISERTVREHIARIFLKLGVTSRVEAAVMATEWRLSNQRARAV
jgi:DNA-binding NarL/FixJ family response regulator